MSDLCEWYGWTVRYVMWGEHIDVMLEMYDYGCEKHYGRPVKRTTANEEIDFETMKADVEAAMKRNGMNVG